ncbi:MAG: PCRF domain-containing protein, partial [Alphaproteobacteria bacterium]|nr:PCRF domain-containing protein [Alphaproteobacteria bacterium]
MWDDPEAAQALMQKRNALEGQMNAIGEIDQEMNDLIELAELADEEGDEASLNETQELIEGLRDRAAKAEIEALLSGEVDANDCFVEIHPGAGGTESNDWASMLLRMYVRWAEQHGYKVGVIDQQSGEEAGIKSATIQIKGHNAYGWLKTESGVHRL